MEVQASFKNGARFFFEISAVLPFVVFTLSAKGRILKKFIPTRGTKGPETSGPFLFGSISFGNFCISSKVVAIQMKLLL
ncbi:MAG: hypothetical protein KJO20_07295 [Eudoraea sp.]|nr:hypothetical protein [Eudoraea sp.]